MFAALAPYRAIALSAFRQSLAHRGEILWNWAGSALYMSIQLALWAGVYKFTNVAPSGLTLQKVWTWTIMLHTTYDVVTAGWEAPKQLQEKIRQGTVAIDLLRPVPLPLALAADAAGRALYGVVHGVPGVVAIWLLKPSPPADWLAGLLFPFSLLLALAVNFELHLLVRMTGFWTGETKGAYSLLRHVNEIFSGEVFPVWFLPGVLQTMALWSPFPAVANTPYSIYTGVVAGPDALFWFGLQGVWALILGLLCLWVWRRAQAQLQLQGG